MSKFVVSTLAMLTMGAGLPCPNPVHSADSPSARLVSQTQNQDPAPQKPMTAKPEPSADFTIYLDGVPYGIYRRSLDLSKYSYMPRLLFKRDGDGFVMVNHFAQPFTTEKKERISITLLRNPPDTAARLAAEMRKQGKDPFVAPADMSPVELDSIVIQDVTVGRDVAHRFEKIEKQKCADAEFELSMLVSTDDGTVLEDCIKRGDLSIEVKQTVVAEGLVSYATAMGDFESAMTGQNLVKLIGDCVSDKDALLSGKPITVTRNQAFDIARKLRQRVELQLRASVGSPFAADAMEFLRAFESKVFSSEEITISQQELEKIDKYGFEREDLSPSKVMEIVNQLDKASSAKDKQTWDRVVSGEYAKKTGGTGGFLGIGAEASTEDSRKWNNQDAGSKEMERSYSLHDMQSVKGEFNIPKKLHVYRFETGTVIKDLKLKFNAVTTTTIFYFNTLTLTPKQGGDWTVDRVWVSLFQEAKATEYLAWQQKPNKLFEAAPEPTHRSPELKISPAQVRRTQPLVLCDLLDVTPKNLADKTSLFVVSVQMRTPDTKSVVHEFVFFGLPSGRVAQYGSLEFRVVNKSLVANVLPADLEGVYVAPERPSVPDKPAAK